MYTQRQGREMIENNNDQPKCEEVAITTVQMPVVGPTSAVRWEIACVEQLMHNRLSTEVDFGWPDSKIEYYGNRAKDPPQEINIKRTRDLFDERRSRDEYEVSLYLRPSTDMEVTWSLTVSSGEPNIERRIFHKMRAAIASHKFGPCASFRLGDLGQVGQIIKSTNRMRLKVELSIVAERVDSRRMIILPGPTLPSAISALRESEELRELSDVELVSCIDDSSYPAHRLILSARSPVFRAMFCHDMQETRTGRVLVEASSSALNQLLSFIYTDEISDLKQEEEKEQTLTEVFEMGARYELPRLQSLAEKQMQETLTIDNVAQRLVLAVRHSSKLLEGPCMSMVRNNISEVMKTDGWKLIANDSTVMAALVCHNQTLLKNNHNSGSSDNEEEKEESKSRASKKQRLT